MCRKHAAAPAQINPVTVYGMLQELAVPKDEWLLQTAASSVLGRQVIALAKHHGIKTINVVRRADAVQELKDAGCVRGTRGGVRGAVCVRVFVVG